MSKGHVFPWLLFLLIVMVSLTGGKGIGGGRSSSVPRGSGYNRGTNQGNMGKPRSGSNFKSNAMSFAAGAAGGVAAYSLMRSMSGSYRSRHGDYYGPGYGVGETCVNNENLNGTVFGQFRCPLNGFPYEAKYCCGEYGKQFCCIRERQSRFLRSSSHFGWIVLVIVTLLIVLLLWTRHRRRQQDMVFIPSDPSGPMPFYQPPPPSMGYPPGNFNPYAQQPHMPYPPHQQPPFRPY